jgi:hypothetical protein
VAFAVWNPKPAPSTRPVSRFTITLPPGQQLAGLDTGTVVALSPDGTHLAYAATQGGTQQLYLRAMDSLERPNSFPARKGRSALSSPPMANGWGFSQAGGSRRSRSAEEWH